MQVVSGSYGNLNVHYEAPPSKDLPQLINQFLNWYQNFSEKDLGKVGEAMLFSALVHLYFETLHPFEDGNGRSARLLEKWFLKEFLGRKAFAVQLEKNYYKNLQNYYKNLKKIGIEYVDLDYNKSLDFLLMTVNSLKN